MGFVFTSGDYTEISYIPSNSKFIGECVLASLEGVHLGVM